MTTFLVFSIPRGKLDISLDRVEVLEEGDEDPFETAAKMVQPPFGGQSLVVKEDDTRRFKLQSRVVEVHDR